MTQNQTNELSEVEEFLLGLSPKMKHDIRLRIDFEYFLEQVNKELGFVLPDLHRRMSKKFSTNQLNIGICAFRNSAKSFISQAFCCWRIFNNPAIWILIVSGETIRAQNFSAAVQTMLATVSFLSHLKTTLGSTTWSVVGSKGEWPTMSATSVGSGLRGRRADLIILDDPISSRHIESQPVQNKTNLTLFEIPLILNPPGRAYEDKSNIPAFEFTQTVCLFTPTAPQPFDAYQQSDSSFFNRFSMYFFPAVLDDKYDDSGFLIGGTSAWPERWPIDVLIQEQNVLPHKFQVERQVNNAPLDDSKSLIRIDKIRQEIINVPAGKYEAYTDPSGGGDPWAWSIGCQVMKPDGLYTYVRRLGDVTSTPDVAICTMLDEMLDLGVTVLNVENNYPLASSVKTEAQRRNQNLLILEFKTSKNKKKKLTNDLPIMMNSGRVIFHPEVLSSQKVVMQLRGLRAGQELPVNDDMIECLFWLLEKYETHIHFVDQNIPSDGGIVRY